MKATDADEHSQLLSKANHGAAARLAASHLLPHIAQLEVDVLTRLKSDFRTGKFDAVALQCEVARLVALDDLAIKLKGEMHAGDAATKRIQGKGES